MDILIKEPEYKLSGTAKTRIRYFKFRMTFFDIKILK